MKNQVRLLYYGVVSSLILLFVTLITVFLFLILFVCHDNEEIGEFQKKSHKYQSLVYNPTTNELELGKVSIYEEIASDSYKSYVDSSGNSVLISPFGSTEYKCYGTCSCSDDQIRRNAGLLQTGKTLIYFLASTTLFAATLLAKKHFEDACHDELSESCATNSVKYRVSECKEIFDGEEIDVKKDESEEKYVHYNYRENIVVSTFKCSGFCLQRESIKNHYEFWVQEMFPMSRIMPVLLHHEDDPSVGIGFDTFKKMAARCTRMEMNDIEVVVEEVLPEKKDRFLNMRIYMTALEKFRTDHLEDFCSSWSLIHDDEIETFRMQGMHRKHKIIEYEDQWEFDYDVFAWCWGRMINNKNINCRKIMEDRSKVRLERYEDR